MNHDVRAVVTRIVAPIARPHGNVVVGAPRWRAAARCWRRVVVPYTAIGAIGAVGAQVVVAASAAIIAIAVRDKVLH